MKGIVRRKSLLVGLPAALLCLLLLAAWTSRTPHAAPLDCPVIYNPGNGWLVDLCPTDPQIETPMEVLLDSVSYGDAALVRVYHQSQAGPGFPQVAVLYASGYVRLKQNADPDPRIPFGSSFVLGPAYWPAPSTYHHNPQLNRLEIDTRWLPDGPLRLRAVGANHDFDVAYEMRLPPPRDRQTRLHVTQTYTATAAADIDPGRRAEAQGFKLVQASSMFINEGEDCDGYTGCHDSNATRFIGSDLARHEVTFATLTPPSPIFSPTLPLGNTWLDLLHTDDQSWQGNTPNVRIALDALPPDRTLTPQGWVGATTDPNQDNVGLWLHDDGPASQSWLAGQSDQVGYWLLAQDDPPEPWADLGLRTGFTFLDFEGDYDCVSVLASPPVTGTVAPIAGYTGTALQLNYDLGDGLYNWAQIRCNFHPPLDLSAYDHLRFDWRGDPAAANSLEIGLINPGGRTEQIFARGYNHITHRPWWGQLVIPFSFLDPWAPDTTFDPSQVSAFFVSVVKDGNDGGGAGTLAIDNLSAFNAISRTVPSHFDSVTPNPTASTAAADWLASQQQASGLLKSWEPEAVCTAHVYDQALALLVFVNEGMWAEADAIVDALSRAQNLDGSWHKSYRCDQESLPCVHCHKWEGDIAWAIYALSRYLHLGGAHPSARATLENAAAWLAARLAGDGCLQIDHTEGTLDAWWALQAAGPAYAGEAQALKNCLLTHYWDGTMGRFKGGIAWMQPYLDNQTWGAAFLKAIGHEAEARQALSYAWEALRLPAQGGQLFGFDGQGGPWSVWNEGTGQYIAVGGDGADDLLLELLAQQREDGALPGSPDDLAGGGVWTTRWHGVAPTAWLYNALNGEPFHPTPHRIYLPRLLRNSVASGTVRGSVVLEDGRCCVGGLVGQTITVTAEHESSSPISPTKQH
jgi:hypothetical protein